MDLRTAERTELAAALAIARAAPPDVAQRIGITWSADRGVMILLAPAIDVLSFNRIRGLGVEGPVEREQLRALIAEGRRRGSKRLFVQVVPDAEPPELTEWIEAEGGVFHNRWVRLWRRTTALPATPTDLRIAPLGPEHGSRVGEILSRSFAFPVELEPWTAATVGYPGMLYHGAFDGDRLVAAGAVYLAEGAGWLGMAATEPEYRGRGAQSALLAARIEAARDHGLEWVVVEAAEPAPGEEAPSWKNLVRLGFEEGYRRGNWVVRTDGERTD